MLIGYARVSKADGSPVLDLQLDALIDVGIGADRGSTRRPGCPAERTTGPASRPA